MLYITLLSLVVIYFSYKVLQHINCIKQVSSMPGVSQPFPFSFFRIPFFAPYAFHGNNQEQFHFIRDTQGSKRICRLVQGSRINVFITGLDELKQVFLKSADIMLKPKVIYEGLDLFGENILTITSNQTWKLHHALCSPTFSTKHMAYMADIASESTDLLLGQWEKKWKCLEGGDRLLINVEKDMATVTLDIIGKAGFGTDLKVYEETTDFDKRKFSYSFREALEYLIMHGIIFLGLFPRWMHFLFTKTNTTRRDVDRYMDNLIENYRSQHKDSERLDLMSLLLHANDCDELQDEEGNRMKRIKLSDRDLKANMFIFLGAGHETTATQLSWTLIELSRNPELMKKLQREVDEILPNKRIPTYEDFEKLKYVNSVVQESLRLHPPVYSVPKRAERKTTIAGYKIPKGSFIWINIYAIHRDPQYWPEPETFNPERFYDETLKKKIKPLTYLPFSAGIRKCLGFQFSYVESCMILARFAQFYDVHLPDGVDPESALKETPFVTVKPSLKNLVIMKRK